MAIIVTRRSPDMIYNHINKYWDIFSESAITYVLSSFVKYYNHWLQTDVYMLYYFCNGIRSMYNATINRKTCDFVGWPVSLSPPLQPCKLQFFLICSLLYHSVCESLWCNGRWWQNKEISPACCKRDLPDRKRLYWIVGVYCWCKLW